MQRNRHITTEYQMIQLIPVLFQILKLYRYLSILVYNAVHGGIIMEELDQNMRIMRLFRRCHAIIHSKMCGGKSSQSEILRTLHRNGPQTQKELLEKMNIRQATLSETLSKMEENGLIIKSRPENDRRVTVIDLSDKGTEITLACREKHHRQRDALLECFTDEEKQTLEKLLSKWYEHMNESEGKTCS